MGQSVQVTLKCTLAKAALIHLLAEVLVGTTNNADVVPLCIDDG